MKLQGGLSRRHHSRYFLLFSIQVLTPRLCSNIIYIFNVCTRQKKNWTTVYIIYTVGNDTCPWCRRFTFNNLYRQSYNDTNALSIPGGIPVAQAHIMRLYIKRNICIEFIRKQIFKNNYRHSKVVGLILGVWRAKKYVFRNH